MLNFVKLNVGYYPFKFQITWLSESNFMEVTVKPLKTPLSHCYDVFFIIVFQN